MCGILGVIDLRLNRNYDINLFVSMNDKMVHRGPDGEGFFFQQQNLDQEKIDKLNSRKNCVLNSRVDKRQVFLGHRRLSIVDLDLKAGQPMINESGDIVISFNGEVYNHAKLREQLVNKGYQFKTSHSDTEAILYSYQEWGEEFVHKLRGMYAIAIWDSRKDSLYLIRDRIGIKPLYYTVNDQKIYFASEIKSIIGDRFINREINHKGLYDYLSFLTVPAPETLFKNIFKIPAGHMLKVENGKVSKLIKYWDVFDSPTDLKDKSEEEIKKNLVEELRESVELRMGADVPVGVFLSGGIDSSLNAKLFTDAKKESVSAFSVGYENDDELKSYKNEFQYSRLISEKLNCDYHEKSLTQKMLIDFLPDLVHFQDEPIADPVCFPVYQVSKLAKENNITVCQVGEGSDELFWGYSSWKIYYQLEKLNRVPGLKIIKRFVLYLLRVLGKTGHAYELLRRSVDSQPIFWSGAEAFKKLEKEQLASDSFKEKIGDYTSYQVIEEYHKEFLSKAPEKSFLNWMAYSDLKLRLPELLLMRVDKMGMAVSLEARVPFLDHKFVSYALSIPEKLRSKEMMPKYILKKAIEGLLPNEIIYRKKQGFGAPVYDWFFNDLGDIAKDKIKNFNEHENLFSNSYLEKLYASGDGTRVWYLLNLVLWWEYFIYLKNDLEK